MKKLSIASLLLLSACGSWQPQDANYPKNFQACHYEAVKDSASWDGGKQAEVFNLCMNSKGYYLHGGPITAIPGQ